MENLVAYSFMVEAIDYQTQSLEDRCVWELELKVNSQLFM